MRRMNTQEDEEDNDAKVAKKPIAALMSIKSLKAELQSYGLSTEGYLDKESAIYFVIHISCQGVRIINLKGFTGYSSS